MEEIRIDVGVCTMFNITLTSDHFDGVKEIIFTIKNYPAYNSEAIVERTFTEAGEHKIIIKPEESIKLTDNAVYDFNKVLVDGDTRLKMTDNGKVRLRKSVGDCLDEH